MQITKLDLGTETTAKKFGYRWSPLKGKWVRDNSAFNFTGENLFLEVITETTQKAAMVCVPLFSMLFAVRGF